MTIRIEAPIALPSVANGSHGHWTTRHKRVKAQRNAVTLAFWSKSHTMTALKTALVDAGGIVTLTRVSPRKLDSDNLAYAFKAVRDEVAAYFGVNDNDPRIEWKYAQAKGKAGVVIEFEVRAC